MAEKQFKITYKCMTSVITAKNKREAAKKFKNGRLFQMMFGTGIHRVQIEEIKD